MNLILTFLFFSICVLFIFISSNLNKKIKAILIFFGIYLSTSIVGTMNNASGWYTNHDLPDEFYPIWIEVKEPNKKTKESGYIYIWCYAEEHIDSNNTLNKFFTIFDINLNTHSPRVYRVDYSRLAHISAEKIKKAIAKMGKVRIAKEDSENNPDKRKLSIGGTHFEIRSGLKLDIKKK